MSSKTLEITVVVFAVLIFGGNRYAVRATGSGQWKVTISGLTKFGANKPTCSCQFGKFADCIGNTIGFKEALMRGYNELARKWGKFWTSTDSGQRVELTEIDWGKMNEASKRSTLEALSAEFRQFAKDEEEMTSKIGAPKGCGYEFYSGTLAMKTDPLSCKINMTLAKQVEEAVPCKDLYQIAFRHEVMHLQKCQARLNGKKLLTPAGLALEEAEGYAQEIAKLKTLLKANCDSKEPSSSPGISSTAQTSHAMTASADRTLVAGGPPLTQEMVNQLNQFLEWALDISLTSAQREQVKTATMKAWSTRNKEEMDSTLLLLQVQAKLSQATAAERAGAREKTQPELLKALRADSNDETSRMLLSVYESAHRKTRPASEGAGAQKSEADLRREIGRAWNYNPSEHRGKNGQRFTYVCPAKGEPYELLGSDIYADHSSLCTAAVHAGLITFDRGGTVTIEIRPGQSSYQGSRRNGMNSRSWHAEDGSFVFVH
jgi:hypothetical protein